MLKSVSPLGRRFQMDQVTVGVGFNPTLGNRFKKRWILLHYTRDKSGKMPPDRSRDNSFQTMGKSDCATERMMRLPIVSQSSLVHIKKEL